MLDIVIYSFLVFINYNIREIGSTNIILRYLISKIISKRLNEEKVLFNFLMNFQFKILEI